MKIKWGALVVDGRNKIGGQVASKNKSGSYMKNKVTPTNPNTTAQANARANLTSLSRSWSSLDQVERDAWNSYAAQYPYVDIFGDSKYLTGFAYYLKCNLNLLNAGSAGIDTPPSTQDVPDLSFIIGDLGAPNTFEISSSIVTMPANTKVCVLSNAGLSAGRQVSKSDLRQIMVATALTAGVIDIAGAYATKFGNISAGLRYGAGTFCINTNTGLTSQLRIVSAVEGSL